MAIHDSPHPFAGRQARIASGLYEGALVVVVDWFDRLSTRSWAESGSHADADAYTWRAAYERLPIDDEVVFARLHRGAALFHTRELTSAAIGLGPAESAALSQAGAA